FEVMQKSDLNIWISNAHCMVQGLLTRKMWIDWLTRVFELEEWLRLKLGHYITAVIDLDNSHGSPVVGVPWEWGGREMGVFSSPIDGSGSAMGIPWESWRVPWELF